MATWQWRQRSSSPNTVWFGPERPAIDAPRDISQTFHITPSSVTCVRELRTPPGLALGSPPGAVVLFLLPRWSFDLEVWTDSDAAREKQNVRFRSKNRDARDTDRLAGNNEYSTPFSRLSRAVFFPSPGPCFFCPVLIRVSILILRRITTWAF